MKIYFDVYAVKLTEENIPQIIEATAPFGWTLHYDLQDTMEFNAEDGFDTILYMKLFKDTTDIATFANEPDSLPDQSPRLTDETDPKFGIFYKLEKI